MLLVEPNFVLAEAASRMFAAYDVVVTAAPDMRVAIHLMAQLRFDCALVDVDLWEGTDGVELARRIQRQHPKIHVALSTRLNHQEVECATSLSVSSKPYRFDAVVAAFCVPPALGV